MPRARALVALGSLILLAVMACAEPEEAPRVRLRVASDPSAALTSTNDEGYEVTLTEARMIVADFEFSTAGEVHRASLWRRAQDALVPSARAHPGHYEGGTITGALGGRYVVNLLAREPLGEAELIVGTYQAANFDFEIAGEADVGADDALLGHTAVLRGTASKGEKSIEFTARLDAPAGRQLVGVPFPFDVTEESAGVMGFQFLSVDPFEEDTVFDGLDFAALDEDEDGELLLSAESSEGPLADAYALLRRTILTHDHYAISLTR